MAKICLHSLNYDMHVHVAKFDFSCSCCIIAFFPIEIYFRSEQRYKSTHRMGNPRVLATLNFTKYSSQIPVTLDPQVFSLLA